MNLTEWEIQHQLHKLYVNCHENTLKDRNKYVVFSDLHAGDRKPRDDFFRNGEMFIRIIREYYYPRGYTLILNGDIEELQKFSIGRIHRRWKDLVEAFEEFNRDGRLIKLIGNHDLELKALKKEGINSQLEEAIRFSYKKNTIFILHGHQASGLFTNFNWFIGGILKYLAAPLHIKNRSAAHDSRRRYQVERRIYRFSKNHRILSIIGHTHRPLFESHSKRDSLRFKIEELLNSYQDLSKKKKAAAKEMIELLRIELESLSRKEKIGFRTPSFYNQNILLPCLFNSGCAIGKRGITNIELADGKIRLIHWFDKTKKTKPYWEESTIYHLGEEGISMRLINEDSLDNIFNRIQLLSPGGGLYKNGNGHD